jgi:hypothetical protein
MGLATIFYYDSQGYDKSIGPRLRMGYWIILKDKVKVKATSRLTVSQSVSLGAEPHLGLMTRYFHYSLTVTVLFFWGRLLWREDGFVFCICCWPFPAQSFSGPSPLGLATIFYCLRFETSLFVASYDSQGHDVNQSYLHGSLYSLARIYENRRLLVRIRGNFCWIFVDTKLAYGTVAKQWIIHCLFVM